MFGFKVWGFKNIVGSALGPQAEVRVQGFCV